MLSIASMSSSLRAAMATARDGASPARVMGHVRAGVPRATCLRMSRAQATANGTEKYVPPSSVGGGSELEDLTSMSQLLSDTIEITMQDGPKNAAAASTIDLLFNILDNPNVSGAFKSAISNAFQVAAPPANYPSFGDVSALEAYRIDLALVNVGAMLAQSVTGRISTEIDPRLAGDTQAVVARARAIGRLYRQAGVAQDRLLMRIPATWPGIQAMKALEEEGYATHAIFVYSFPQAAAAAQAGVSVLQVSMGRTRSWYQTHPGVVRDPYGPREDSGYRSPVDPGLALTTQIFNYVKKFYPRTRVMVSGVASRADALAVAGADFIVAPASVVEELANTPTAAGYNDGLSGAGEGVGAVERRLDAEAARRVELREDTVPVLDEATFRSMLEKSVCGSELLSQGLARHNAHLDAVRKNMGKFALGME